MAGAAVGCGSLAHHKLQHAASEPILREQHSPPDLRCRLALKVPQLRTQCLRLLPLSCNGCFQLLRFRQLHGWSRIQREEASVARWMPQHKSRSATSHPQTAQGSGSHLRCNGRLQLPCLAGAGAQCHLALILARACRGAGNTQHSLRGPAIASKQGKHPTPPNQGAPTHPRAAPAVVGPCPPRAAPRPAAAAPAPPPLLRAAAPARHAPQQSGAGSKGAGRRQGGVGKGQGSTRQRCHPC